MSYDNIPAHIQELAAKIEGKLVIDEQTGVAGALDKELVESMLPEGITLASIKSHQIAALDIADAASLALVRKALPVLEKNKDLDRVSLAKTRIGHDSFAAEALRQRKSRNPKTGEEIIKHGVLVASYNSGIGAKRGNFAKIAEAFNTEATSVFSK